MRMHAFVTLSLCCRVGHLQGAKGNAFPQEFGGFGGTAAEARKGAAATHQHLPTAAAGQQSAAAVLVDVGG